MSNSKLKSLDWEALFKRSSDDDEYDSDETICGEVEGVNNVMDPIESVASVRRSADKLQTQVKIDSPSTCVLPNINNSYTYHKSSEYTKENLREENKNKPENSKNTLFNNLKNEKNNSCFPNTTLKLANMPSDCFVRTTSEVEINSEEKSSKNLKSFLLVSPETKRGLMTEQKVSKSSKSDYNIMLFTQSPVGLTTESPDVAEADTVTLNIDNNETLEFVEKENSLKQEKGLPSEECDNTRQTSQCDLEIETMKELATYCSFESFDSVLENTDTNNSPSNLCGTFQIGNNEYLLQTENYNSEISNKECLANILQMDENFENSDAVEGILQNINSSSHTLTDSLGNFLELETNTECKPTKGNTCSPPLTLIEIVRKKNIAAKKISFKKENCFAKKILPTRRCQSKYIDESIRLSELEKSPKSDCNSKGFDRKGKKNTKQVKYLGFQTNNNVVKTKARGTESDIREGKNKPQGSCLENLKVIKKTLNEIEEIAHNWFNGKEYVSREKAIKMLFETQSNDKKLETLQIPMRSRGELMKKKNSLRKQAKELALALDKAIVESDQMYRQDLFKNIVGSSRYGAKHKESNEGRADIPVTKNRKRIQVKQLHSCYPNKQSKGNLNDDHKCGDLMLDSNTEPELKENNTNSINKAESLGRKSIQKYIPGIKVENYLSENPNRQMLQSNLKPILKNLGRKRFLESSIQIPSEKHISFSDDIELHFLSGGDKNKLENNTNENTDYSDNYSSESKNVFNETNKNVHLELKIKGSEPNQLKSVSRSKNNDELVSDAFDVILEESLVIVPGTSTNLDYSHPNVSYMQNVDSVKGSINGENKYTVDDNIEHSTTDLSHLDNLSEGFGFTEDIYTDQLSWGNICIADIKYLRIKSSAEFAPQKDHKSVEDLDKW